MTKIKTYPNMNKEIKYILSQSRSYVDQYAVARIIELEKALEFYGDEETYTDDRQYTSTGALVHTGYTKIECDNGEKAREALKEDEDNEGN